MGVNTLSQATQIYVSLKGCLETHIISESHCLRYIKYQTNWYTKWYLQINVASLFLKTNTTNDFSLYKGQIILPVIIRF